MNPQEETVAVNVLTLRQAILHIHQLVKMPDNKAAQSLARISAETLSGYLPENLTDDIPPPKKA